jgi:hypothetical protein
MTTAPTSAGPAREQTGDDAFAFPPSPQHQVHLPPRHALLGGDSVHGREPGLAKDLRGEDSHVMVRCGIEEASSR